MRRWADISVHHDSVARRKGGAYLEEGGAFTPYLCMCHSLGCLCLLRCLLVGATALAFPLCWPLCLVTPFLLYLSLPSLPGGLCHLHAVLCHDCHAMHVYLIVGGFERQYAWRTGIRAGGDMAHFFQALLWRCGVLFMNGQRQGGRNVPASLGAIPLLRRHCYFLGGGGTFWRFGRSRQTQALLVSG